MSIVLALLWFLALRKQDTDLALVVGLVHGVFFTWLMALPEWSLMSGPGLLFVSCWVFGGLAIVWMREPWGSMLPIAQAVLCILSGVGVASAMGADPPTVNVWTIPHVATAIAWFVLMIAATVVALCRLRGRRVGLLLAALVLAALPMLSPYATLVQFHQDGHALTAEATLHDSEGDTEVIRIVPVRGELPYEAPLRQSAILVILAGFAVAFVKKKARTTSQSGALGIVVVSVVGIHALLLATALFPRPIESSHPEVVETVRDQLLLETNSTESVVNITAAMPPYAGGPGMVAPIVLSALTLLLVCLGYYGRRDRETFEERSSLLERLEVRVVAWGVVCWSFMLLTGGFWSDTVWGSFVVADPKMYAQIVVGGLYVLYFLVQRIIPERSDAPSWLLLAVCLVALLSLLGPELGLTAPTLHNFGG